MVLYGPKQLAGSMRTVRKNTIVIAEDIPEKEYSYRPTPGSRSVAETLRHIALLSRADLLIHEEQHLSSLEGYDFGQLIKNSETEESASVPRAILLPYCSQKGIAGAGGWRDCRTRCCQNKCACPAVARRAGLKCSWGPKSTKCITADS